MMVYPRGNFISANEIETATEVLTDYFVERFPELATKDELYESYKNTKIHIIEDNFRCIVRRAHPQINDGEPVIGLCSGIYIKSTIESHTDDLIYINEGDKIKYVYEDCIGDSSFVHEILHLIAERASNFWFYHGDERFFSEEPGSVEYDVNYHITETKCLKCI
jgi:hypothetical protein